MVSRSQAPPLLLCARELDTEDRHRWPDICGRSGATPTIYPLERHKRHFLAFLSLGESLIQKLHKGNHRGKAPRQLGQQPGRGQELNVKVRAQVPLAAAQQTFRRMIAGEPLGHTAELLSL